MASYGVRIAVGHALVHPTKKLLPSQHCHLAVKLEAGRMPFRGGSRRAAFLLRASEPRRENSWMDVAEELPRLGLVTESPPVAEANRLSR
jgi:hypothetical protein